MISDSESDSESDLRSNFSKASEDNKLECSKVRDGMGEIDEENEEGEGDGR